MKELVKVDFGPPLHCLIIPGKTHPMEDEMLSFFDIERTQYGGVLTQ
jgi:diphthine synthase